MRLKKLGIILLLSAVIMIGQSIFAYAQEQIDEVIEIYTLDESSHISAGFDMTFLLGAMTKNGFGYPKKMFGVSPFLGIDWRKFSLPSARIVRYKAERLLESNPNLSTQELLEKVKEEMDLRIFRYFQIGTEILIMPKIGIGWMFSLTDEHNVFFDFGINFPFLINLGIIVSF